MVTGIASRTFHAKEEALGEDWFHRGEASLAKNAPSDAIDEFRSALSYSRDNPDYRLRLAQALVAAHRLDEAQAHLLGLWEAQPSNGTVNLELARLAAARGNTQDAIRYYHSAIIAVWDRNPALARRQARFEFCEYLLDHGLRTQAQAALIELATNIPDDAELRERVGTLMLRAEDPARALQQFEQAIRIDRNRPTALLGAGEASYRLADYREAQRYLEHAAKLSPLNEQDAQHLELSRLILEIDPYDRRLSAAERTTRAIRIYQQAFNRLKQCGTERGEGLDVQQPASELQSAYSRAKQILPNVTRRSLQTNPDLQAKVIDLSLEIEQLSDSRCGPGKSMDSAILLAARKHEGESHD